MGTDSPHVTISAATLAGGEKNQDRYAYGDGWAFVLDGASSFATAQPEHDGGWYAERLKVELSHELTASPRAATTDCVAQAIEAAASAHTDPRTCPTSTIAMARWSANSVEVYVLGDSTAALISSAAEEIISDSRIAAIGEPLREKYRTRLKEGYGFDEHHRQLLQRLQEAQLAARNSPNGYWIAGANPNAAYHGLSQTVQISSLSAIVLASDGAARALEYEVTPSWKDFTQRELALTLHSAIQVEVKDARGQKWPRSKLHDDKTAAIIWFHR